MTSPSTQLVADLRAARALIAAPGGWCQGSYYVVSRESPTGEACCASGAPRSALRDLVGEEKAERVAAVQMALLDRLIRPGLLGNLPGWNDDPSRTQAEVIALYDRAIEIAGGGE